MEGADEMYWALSGAIRMLGYVCAPALFQRVIEKCLWAKPNIAQYQKNHDLLLDNLTRIGFECTHPDGAFYICIKAKDGDSEALSELAKSLGILIIPCDEFGAKGFVRIAYCVKEQTIIDSIPAFEKLYELMNK